MNALNLRNGRKLSYNVVLADSLFKRMRGLLGRSEMLAGEALWIKPCMSVHTFLMKFSIDIAFLDKKNHVVAAIKGLRPNRVTKLYLRAASALELTAGVLETTDTRIGDEIEIV